MILFYHNCTGLCKNFTDNFMDFFRIIDFDFVNPFLDFSLFFLILSVFHKTPVLFSLQYKAVNNCENCG